MSAFENVLIKEKLKVFFKFRAETWNLAKTKVGEEEKFHNIDVGQKLIRVLDLGENKGQGYVNNWNLTKPTRLTLITMLKWWLATKHGIST